MTTTAQITARIATTTDALAELVIIGAEDFETCELCGHAAAELFTRIDNRDNSEIEVCEHCADHADVSHTEF